MNSAPPTEPSEGRLGRTATHLLGLAVATAPLLIGGAPVAAQVVTFAIVAAAALLVAADAAATSRVGRAPVILLGLGLVVFSSLRALSLWANLLPEGSAALGMLPEGLDAPLDGRPGSLHLAPGAAHAQTLHLACVLLTGGVAWHLTEGAPTRKLKLAIWLLAGGAAVVGVGMLQLVTGADLVGQVYETGHFPSAAPFASTLRNSNHLASYLLLVSVTAFGLTWVATGPLSMITTLLIFLGATVGLVLTFSRGGLAAFAAGMGIALLLRRIHLSDDATRLRPVVGVGLVTAVAAASAAIYRYADRFSERALHLDLGFTGDLDPKFAGWDQALALAREHPWIGVGAGAMADAVAPLQHQGGDAQMTFAESLPLQLLVDHGAPLALLLLACGAAVFWRLFARVGRERAELMMLAGLAAVVLKDLADYALYMPGVAIPAAAIAGSLASVAWPGREGDGTRAWVWVLPLVVCGTAAAAPTLRWERLPLEQRHQALARNLAGLDDELRDALAAYPHDGNLLAMAGKRVERDMGLAAAEPWYAAAQARAPYRLYANLVAAWAWQRGERPADAAAAYARVAAATQTQEVRTAWADALGRGPRAGEVIQALADLSPDAATEPVRTAWRRGDLPLARQLADRAMAAGDPSPLLRYWRGRLAILSRDDTRASLEAAYLLGDDDGRGHGFLLEGHRLWERDPKIALTMMRQAATSMPREEEAALMWVQAALRTDDMTEFQRSMQHLASLAERRPRIRAHVPVFRAVHAARHGRKDTALRLFRRLGRELEQFPREYGQYLSLLREAGRTVTLERLCAQRASLGPALQRHTAAPCAPDAEAKAPEGAAPADGKPPTPARRPASPAVHDSESRP